MPRRETLLRRGHITLLLPSSLNTDVRHGDVVVILQMKEKNLYIKYTQQTDGMNLGFPWHLKDAVNAGLSIMQEKQACNSNVD